MFSSGSAGEPPKPAAFGAHENCGRDEIMPGVCRDGDKGQGRLPGCHRAASASADLQSQALAPPGESPGRDVPGPAPTIHGPPLETP